MTERSDAHSAPEAGAADAAAPAPGAGHFEEAPMTESPDHTHDQTDGDVNTEAVNDADGDIVDTDTGDGDIVDTHAVDGDSDDLDPAVVDPAVRDAAPSGKPEPGTSSDAASTGAGHPDTRLAAERLEDLQRLQAEYVNYKRRVDRDRALVQEKAIADVLDSLLPVMDDIHAAREHGDLSDGPFAAIAEKLEGSLGKFGLERFGVVGESFDPNVHEALLHQAWDGSVEAEDSDATTIVMVLQPGYRAGDRVIRPARVAVADPA